MVHIRMSMPPEVKALYDEAIELAKRVYGPGKSEGFYLAKIAKHTSDKLGRRKP